MVFFAWLRNEPLGNFLWWQAHFYCFVLWRNSAVMRYSTSDFQLCPNVAFLCTGSPVRSVWWWKPTFHAFIPARRHVTAQSAHKDGSVTKPSTFHCGLKGQLRFWDLLCVERREGPIQSATNTCSVLWREDKWHRKEEACSVPITLLMDDGISINVTFTSQMWFFWLFPNHLKV